VSLCEHHSPPNNPRANPVFDKFVLMLRKVWGQVKDFGTRGQSVLVDYTVSTSFVSQSLQEWIPVSCFLQVSNVLPSAVERHGGKRMWTVARCHFTLGRRC
jgi:hypothetical protein